jgi:hypothetical protein
MSQWVYFAYQGGSSCFIGLLCCGKCWQNVQKMTGTGTGWGWGGSTTGWHGDPNLDCLVYHWTALPGGMHKPCVCCAFAPQLPLLLLPLDTQYHI